MAKRTNKKTKDYNNYYLDRMEKLFKTREEMDQDQWFEVKKVVEWEDVEVFTILSLLFFTITLMGFSFVRVLGTNIVEFVFMFIVAVCVVFHYFTIVVPTFRQVRWVARREQ